VHELWWLEREPGGHPSQANEFSGTRSREPLAVESADLATRAAVVVASEPMDDHPDWQQLASGDLLHVDAHGAVSIRSVLARAPRHPLTLDDLGDTAAASQAGSSGVAPRGPSVR
jgi:glutamine amidotransferase